MRTKWTRAEWLDMLGVGQQHLDPGILTWPLAARDLDCAATGIGR